MPRTQLPTQNRKRTQFFPTTQSQSWILVCFSVFLAACAAAVQPQPPSATPTSTIVPPSSQTPFLPLDPTPTITPTPALSFWLSPDLPAGLVESISLPDGMVTATLPDQASFRVDPLSTVPEDNVEIGAAHWVYALAAPFPTIPDGLTFQEFMRIWKNEKEGGLFQGWPILASEETLTRVQAVLGEPSSTSVEVFPSDQLVDEAWQRRNVLAIVPFEELNPRWKVLRVDGISPLDQDFVDTSYPLVVPYFLTAQPEVLDRLQQESGPDALTSLLPKGNRDPDRLTSVVVTGVTALVRATAWQMNRNGVNFPAQDVGDLLKSADITHISNEVAFAENCPAPDPNTGSLRFCSSPDHFSLLQYVGTDVVELSGNHVNDWGWENLAYSLGLYDEAGIQYYSGGADTTDSRQPALFEHNGNKIAFIGCNPAGPIYAWATDTQAGSANCEGDWLPTEISRLSEEGYQVIATLQYDESYDPVPLPRQVEYFTSLSAAGAAIVSGSQAHWPQGFGFQGERLIHYGLGNLFFDQMYYNGLGPGTRWEFIDRHVFYNGKHISTELVTAMLEEYARPRLMTQEERNDLLALIFKASGW